MTIHIFLADDHAVLRDGLKALLEKQPDIEVVGMAANGRDAVRQVLQHRPHVVIMDIAMPELNGLVASRQILEQMPEAAIIILSMYDDHVQILEALKIGARGYLLKASAGAELVDAVRAAHAGKRYLSPQISDVVVDGYLHLSEEQPAENRLARLSSRELEILQLLVEGHSSAKIARKLSLSNGTVNVYRSRLMQKLEISDMPGLIKFAMRHKLIAP